MKDILTIVYLNELLPVCLIILIIDYNKDCPWKNEVFYHCLKRTVVYEMTF